MTAKQRLIVDIAARIPGEVTRQSVAETLSEHAWLGESYDQLFGSTPNALDRLAKSVQRWKDNK